MISICIPAHNEEESIHGVANNVRKSRLWQESTEKELIFCINGSNDRSEERARRIAAKDPNVKVIVTPKKGKNHAWETLVKESSSKSDFLFFVDADVAVNPDTFSKLAHALERDLKIVIAGARVVPYPEKGFWSTHRRMMEKHFNYSTFHGRRPILFGAAYAIRRSEAIKVEMPKNQAISEDSFLDLLFHERVKILAGATVSFRLPNVIDFIRTEKRKAVSEHYVLKEYPHLRERYKKLFGSPTFRTPRNLTEGEKYARNSMPTINGIIFALKWYDIFTKRDPWRKVKSTKRRR